MIERKKILLLLQIIYVSGHIDYDISHTGRPMPPELVSLLENKTEYEILMEECMKEFTTCLATRGSVHNKICSVNRSDGTKQVFYSICDMSYENCKNSKNNSWHFFKDGRCDDQDAIDGNGKNGNEKVNGGNGDGVNGSGVNGNGVNGDGVNGDGVNGNGANIHGVNEKEVSGNGDNAKGVNANGVSDNSVNGNGGNDNVPYDNDYNRNDA